MPVSSVTWQQEDHKLPNIARLLYDRTSQRSIIVANGEGFNMIAHSRLRTTCSVWRWCLAACVLCFLPACDPSLVKQDIPITSLDELLSGKQLLGDDAQSLSLPEPDILSIDAAMIEFVDRYVPRIHHSRQRLDNLHLAIRSTGVLAMKYEFDATRTASEAFHSGQANCLSYAHLFIALARQAGFNASYQEVKLPHSWAEMDNASSFYYLRHVNVIIQLPFSEATVDIKAPPTYHSARTKRISDNAAFAQHFNNIAVEHMQQGDTLNAFKNFKKAILLAPTDSSIWVNLGTLYRRNKHPRLAESAYLHALSLHDNEYIAMSNLVSLYQGTGEFDKQNYYLDKVEGVRKRNPYNYFYLARDAYKIGDYSTAEEHLTTALRKEKLEYRFHLLMVLIQQKLDNNKAALKHQKIAEGLFGEIEQEMSILMNELS